MRSRRELLKTVGLFSVLPGFLTRFAFGEQAASPAPSKWLDDIAKQLRSEFNFPAVWVAVAIDGIVETAVVGVKKFGDPTPATPDDKLTVASISKPMAGLWIATLVDAGKLTYASRLLDVLPELAAVCLPEHRDITLEQLMTHTAGVIRDATNIPNTLRLDEYRAERLRQARQVVSSPAPPGSKGKELYSNNGVTLAVTMAERAAGEAYETAAGRFYRERLGLKSWGVWAMNMSGDLSVPWPHSMKNKAPLALPPRSVQFQFVRPSGSAYCTISDLIQFGLIATNAAESAHSLLKLETWQTLLRRKENGGTTLCSFSSRGGDLPVYDHSGSLGTTSSHLRVFPEWKTALAFHTNATGDTFRNRGLDVLQDAVRKRRAEKSPPPSCRINLTSVNTVDASWEQQSVPKATDEKVRVRVRFHIEARKRTGDLQTLVKLGDTERRDDRFNGLATGNHTLYFEFDNPKTKTIPLFVKVDSLDTAGNRIPNTAVFESTLEL